MNLSFGTSGLRGPVEAMTDPVCAAWVLGFLRHLGVEGGVVLIGRDLRPSSPRIAAACARAVAARGAVPVDCGVLPTPALALEALRRAVPAVMVSGSHIPFDRNGLKFYRPDGEIDKADEAAIVAALPPGDAVPPDAAAVATDHGVGERYLARVVDFFGSGVLAGRRVGVWQHSAAGRDLLVAALGRLGAAAVPLGRSETFVPVDTEAVAPAAAARIRGWVRAHALDALVSTDGDGDRPLIADETGAVIRGDAVGALTARLIGADAVATPLTSSTALERSGWFAEIARTRVGSPFVVAAMRELGARGARLPVGYEANGGFLTGAAATASDGRRLSPLPTRDALLPIAAVLAAAARSGGLSRLAATLPPRATASDRLPEVPATLSDALLATLAADPGSRAALLAGLGTGEAISIDTLDGVRMTLGSGDILHLRRSGNAPELRLYAEAPDARRARDLIAAVRERLGAQIRRPTPAA